MDRKSTWNHFRHLIILYFKYKCRCQELYFFQETKTSLQDWKSTVTSGNFKLKWAKSKSQIKFLFLEVKTQAPNNIKTVQTTRHSKAWLKWKELEDLYRYSLWMDWQSPHFPLNTLNNFYQEIRGSNRSVILTTFITTSRNCGSVLTLKNQNTTTGFISC